MTQTIPTFVSNEYTPFVLDTNPTLSAFQNQTLFDIATNDNFDFFCGKPEYDHNGPIQVVYYTKDGQLNGMRLGRKKVILQATA